MFKKYPLTIVMFLAGICSIVMALSISHAGSPNVSHQKDAVVEDLQGATEASEDAAQCTGDCATDKVLCNEGCYGDKDCKADCLKQYRDCASQCK